MSNQTFKLTIDAANLNLEKVITHARIVNQYVDVNDSMSITAPIDRFVKLTAQTAVIDIIATTPGSIYQVQLMSRGEALLDAYFMMPPVNKRLSEVELFTAYPPKMPNSWFWSETLNNIQYRMITVYGNYTLLPADCDGRTIVRVESATPCTITVPANISPGDFTGRSLTIRNCVDVIVTIAQLGSTVSPLDAGVLRRIGSTATLIYAGLNRWDLYGELP